MIENGDKGRDQKPNKGRDAGHSTDVGLPPGMGPGHGGTPSGGGAGGGRDQNRPVGPKIEESETPDDHPKRPD